MTRWKWVLLGGPLGMLGLLNFAFGVDSASLSGLTSANEIGDFRVCANTCEADLAGKPCDLFCTSRRQFTIQSNTVAGERDVVVGVGEARRDACPTLCRHGLGALFCTCDATVQEESGSQVPIASAEPPWEKICDLYCEERLLIDDPPECRNGGDRWTSNNEESEELYVPVRIPRSSMDAEVISGPRGSSMNNYVTEERRDGVDTSADSFDSGGSVGLKRSMKKRENNDGADFDWEEFCRIECARGNGGLACNCDVIP